MRGKRIWATVAVASSILIAPAGRAVAHHVTVCGPPIITPQGVRKSCRIVPHDTTTPDNTDDETDTVVEYTIDDVTFVAEFGGGVNPLSGRNSRGRIGSITCPNELSSAGGSVTRAVSYIRDLTFEEVTTLGLDPTDTYARYSINCDDTITAEIRSVVVRTVDGPGFSVVFDGALAEAVANAGQPQIATSPTDRGIVNFPTWLWVENWDPAVGSDDAGYIDIVVTGTPTGSVITTGNDDDPETLTCQGPGQAWDPDAGIDAFAESNCSYTYEYPSVWDDSGVFEIVATTSWTFSWTLNDVDQGTITTLPRTNQLDLRVVEIQTVGVAND